MKPPSAVAPHDSRSKGQSADSRGTRWKVASIDKRLGHRASICIVDDVPRRSSDPGNQMKSLVQAEVTMIFPGLSRFSVPLLGAGQPPASTGPQPNSFRRIPQNNLRGNDPAGGIRVRVLTNAAGTARRQHVRRPLMSDTAGSRAGSQSLSHHPQPIQSQSRRQTRSQVLPPRWRAPGGARLDSGRTLSRRSLPGHKAHHHPARRPGRTGRWPKQLRVTRSDVAGSAVGTRGRGAMVSYPQGRHRRSAASAPSDQESADARIAR